VKILHVSPTYYPATYWGGPIFSVYGLNRALSRIPGVALEVIATDAAGPRASDRLDVDTSSATADAYGYPVWFCRRIAGVSISLQLLRRLPSRIARADVVHLTAVYSFPTIPTLLLCWAYAKPLVWSPRGSLLATHQWTGARRRGLKGIWEAVIRPVALRLRCVLHVTSDEERRASLARIPGLDACIIPNGIDIPEVLPPRAWKQNGMLRLVFVGRISPEKALENLISAVAAVDVPVSLAICGTGDASYVEGLRRQVTKQGLEDRVLFRGHVDDKPDAFADADVCIVPSHSENFGMVVAEALAHGVPVIASHGTPWAALEENGCGLWVDNDPASLARAIETIAPLDLQEMGLRGRAWMRRDFGWAGIAAQMHALYKDVSAHG
jgi:glycosyltransferase involved in cell wall biosynthesis